MNVDELKKEVANINWFHSIDLGHGIVTQGRTNHNLILNITNIPKNLDGMTVLDVGAWDGYYSFLAETRGAKRVLATDNFCWNGDGNETKDGFNLARKVLNSKVEDMEIDVLDLSPEKIGQFDLVLFTGVLYHMIHPMLALEKVYSVTKERLILETHVSVLDIKEPVMEFYPGLEYDNDPTNWWGPNPCAVEAMLKTVGFNKTEFVSIEPIIYKGSPHIKSKFARMGIHALK